MLKSAIILLAALNQCESGFFDTVKAPDLRNERSWNFPTDSNTQLKREAKSLQNSQKLQRKILTGVFLPGLGVYRDMEVETFDSSRGPRKTKSNVDNGLFDDNSIDSLNAPEVTTSTEEQTRNNGGFGLKKSQLFPSRITLSQDSPPAGLRRDDEKCEFVQMKGGTVGDDCMKGGMSCDRQCTFDTSEDQCQQVDEVVCQDVAKDVCNTVMEKTCSTVQEEVCDDPTSSKPMTKCEVVLEEKCETIVDDVCRDIPSMECTTEDKEVCTTMKEQVCRPQDNTECRQVADQKCNLVQDVICRNVTETRFDEKCWTIEEEKCKTVYDTVWENKCDMVNITIPQKNCEVQETTIMEERCEFTNKTEMMPFCIQVEDKYEEEECSDVPVISECFDRSCTNVSVPSFSKSCRDIPEEECEVIIETNVEKKCTDVEKTEFVEECTTNEVEECSEEMELRCEEPSTTTTTSPITRPPETYGVPLADVLPPVTTTTISNPQSTYTGPQGETIRLTSPNERLRRRPKKGAYGSRIPHSATGTRWRRKTKTLSKKLKSSTPIKRTKRNIDDQEEDIELTNEDFGQEVVADHMLTEEGSEIVERSAYYPPGGVGYQPAGPGSWSQHPPYQGVGEVYHRFGNTEYHANFYGQKPTTQRPVLTSTSTVSTSVVPICKEVIKMTCKMVPKTECKEVPKKKVESVCVDYPVSIPRQECNTTMRQECDIIEETKYEERCEAIQGIRGSKIECKNVIRTKPRQECTQVEINTPEKTCQNIPKVQKDVTCDITMKEIELKEICVDIDIQLPREECRKETREDCRFEPTKETVQRCEPTVREECRMEMKEVCDAKCGEICNQEERRMCMMIPQKECQETINKECKQVSRDECRTEPREECTQISGPVIQVDLLEGRCRTNTRLDCFETPREKCGKTFTSECKTVPQMKCNDKKTENCEMVCEPVFWCKMCKNKESIAFPNRKVEYQK